MHSHHPVLSCGTSRPPGMSLDGHVLEGSGLAAARAVSELDDSLRRGYGRSSG